MEKIKLPIEEIVEKWQQGATYIELAKIYKVSTTTIADRIRQGTGESHPKRPIKVKRKGKLPMKEIPMKPKKERCLRGPTLIIEYLKSGFSPEKIKQIAKENSVTIPDDIMEQAIKKYKEYLYKKQDDAR